MTHIISIHSFRRGTGKSMFIANLATVLARQGKRVGLVDTGFRSPSVHILFDVDDTHLPHVLNDYIWGRCDIEQAAYDVSDKIGIKPDAIGALFMVPSSTGANEIAYIAQYGYEFNVLNEGLSALSETMNLDVLMLDTHAGINEETMLSIALCDTMGLIVRVDKQDHQGTAVLVNLARQLGVKDVKLVINDIPRVFDVADVVKTTGEIYECRIAAAIPHTEQIMALGSGGIFVVEKPDHPLVQVFEEAAHQFTF